MSGRWDHRNDSLLRRCAGAVPQPVTLANVARHKTRNRKVDDPKEQATVTTGCSEGPFDADDVVRAVTGLPNHKAGPNIVRKEGEQLINPLKDNGVESQTDHAPQSQAARDVGALAFGQGSGSQRSPRKSEHEEEEYGAWWSCHR